MDVGTLRSRSLSWCELLPLVVRTTIIRRARRILTHGCHASIGSWYKRSEYGKRLAFFFSAAIVSGAFGGVLAVGLRHTVTRVGLTTDLPVPQAAISNMHGVGGRPGWAWIVRAVISTPRNRRQ